LKAAGKNQVRNDIEQQRYWEVCQYEDRIASIRSRRLVAEAENFFIYLPDLICDQGNYGDRYLDKASISRLFHAVKEQKDKFGRSRYPCVPTQDFQTWDSMNLNPPPCIRARL
jgi:hypothetical protein